jgi:hypothetical protein
MGPQIKNPQLPHLRNLINLKSENLRFANIIYGPPTFGKYTKRKKVEQTEGESKNSELRKGKRIPT